MPEIDEWDEKQLLVFEKEFLGFYITGHPLTRYEDVLNKFTNANSISLKEKKDGETIRIGGIIRNVKTINTKKGDLMAFVTIEDLLGSVEVTIFSSVYASVHNYLSGDSPILVQGRIQKDETSVKILVDSLMPIDEAEEKLTASIHFNLDITKTNKESLLKLYDILKKHPGPCLAHIYLCEPEKTETLIALPDTIKVKAGPTLTREVNELFGHNVVETVCTQIPSYSTSNGFKKKRKPVTT
jgi:DNA polymerase-3 subunit alpha